MTTLEVFGRRTFSTNGNLRDMALWWPGIPYRHLSLHEHTFLKEVTYMHGHELFVWVHFGGHGGRNLHHLTQIRALGERKLFRLEFSYEPDADLGIVALARTKALAGRKEASADVAGTTFLIDGPGGEFINKVDIVYFVEVKKKRKKKKHQEAQETVTEVEEDAVRAAQKAESRNDFDQLTVS